MQDESKTFWDILTNIPPMIQGAIMAFIISMLRIIYDDEEKKWQRKLLESMLCAALTIVAGSFVGALGLSTEWILGIGGLIGFLGADYIRERARSYVNSQLDKKK